MPRQPNVLFIISDQHKWDVAGFAGHPTVKTPNLDALSAAGVTFTQAICPSPLCVTCRGSVMTGQYPHTCGALSNVAFPIPDVPTLGSVFRNAGYATGAIGKVHVNGETRQRDLGFDTRELRIYTYKFEDYINAVGEEAVNKYATYRTRLKRYQTSYNPTNEPLDLPEDKIYDELVVDRCIQFMNENRQRPFFLWAGIEKPHPDWTAPARFHAMYDGRKMPLPATVDENRTDYPEAWYTSTRQSYAFDEDEIRNCIAAYYANVTYCDYSVGRLLGALDRLGLAEDTLVVYTTDHGEMLFEHGMVQKQNFFEPSVRVPLIFRHRPRIEAGGVVAGGANLIDLFPTFCQWTGVEAPAGLEGRSLATQLQGDARDADRPVFSEYYEWGFPERMVRTRDWKYMYSHGQPCQLYNLQADPLEQHNLIDDPASQGVRRDLHAQVMAGWEMPDMSNVPHGGKWNKQVTAEQHLALMNEWRRTRKRVKFE